MADSITTQSPSATGSTGGTGDGTSTVDQVKEQAQEVTEQAREQASRAMSRVQDTAREQTDQRSTEVGEKVGTVATDLRSVSGQLRQQGNDSAANLADQVADRADQAGRYLRDSDANRLLADAEDFGRRQPWLVLAGGVIVGIAAARFLKASSARRYDDRWAQQDWSGRSSGRLAYSDGAYTSTTPGYESEPEPPSRVTTAASSY